MAICGRGERHDLANSNIILWFVRYVYDSILTKASSVVANRVMASVTKWIEKKLGLKEMQQNSKLPN